jgi:stress-induced morphogen
MICKVSGELRSTKVKQSQDKTKDYLVVKIDQDDRDVYFNVYDKEQRDLVVSKIKGDEITFDVNVYTKEFEGKVYMQKYVLAVA